MLMLQLNYIHGYTDIEVTFHHQKNLDSAVRNVGNI